MRHVLRAIAVFLLASVLVPVGVSGTILAAFIFLPLPATLPEAKPGIESQISRIYDARGNQIGTFRIFEQSLPVKKKDIPKILKQAVIAAEDRSFYGHGGVDLRGTFRALWKDVRGGGYVQGGSTITQQYVKNAYVGQERSIARKIREAILASQLDRQFEKDEILFRYLSSVYLGEGAFGVGAAADTYFRTPVQKLNLSQVATLAGVIPAPTRYSPRDNPEGAEVKRKIVLNAMLDEGMITQKQFQTAVRKRIVYLGTHPNPKGPHTSILPPRRPFTKYPYFVDYVRRYLVGKYGEDKVFRGGLRVYTTLDPKAQQAAEAAVASTLEGTDPALEMGLASVEPPTGYVRAIVGGRDFAKSEVNLALGTKFGRQPGSSFKPYVLATAFEQGVLPTKGYSGHSPFRIPNCIPTPQDDCLTENYGGGSYGYLDLRSATKASVNTIYVQLILDVGVKNTMDLAHRLGISRSVYEPGKYGASVALGALGTSPLEMASAYGVFAARGLKASPTPVLRVLDNQGQVLEDNTKPDAERVLKQAVADNVTSVLQGVLGPGGTAAGRDIGRPAAGKTGTAQNNKDAWFVGYTPVLSTAVWMGYRDEERELRYIKGVGVVTGGSLPAATWQAYMKAALEDVPVTGFNEPAPLVPVADAAQVRRRGGFELGPRRYPTGASSGGPYIDTLAPPGASPPPPTTSTTVPPTTTAPTTTTTTGPFP